MTTWTWIIAGFVTLDTAAIIGACALLAAIARTPLLAMSALTSIVMPKSKAPRADGVPSAFSGMLNTAISTSVFDVPEE
jgi:hypothetical protein